MRVWDNDNNLEGNEPTYHIFDDKPNVPVCTCKSGTLANGYHEIRCQACIDQHEARWFKFIRETFIGLDHSKEENPLK